MSILTDALERAFMDAVDDRVAEAAAQVLASRPDLTTWKENVDRALADLRFRMREATGIPEAVNVLDFPGDTVDTKYENAVRHIRDTWGAPQWENPPFGGPGPLGDAFRNTSQLTLPGVYFPKGNHKLHKTLWTHPQIPVFGHRRGTRLWFIGDARDYATQDAAYWGKDSANRAPNAYPNAVAIGVPHRFQDNLGRGWEAYEHSVHSLNVKILVEDTPSTGVGIWGHHHNLHLHDLHLVPDVGRRECVAVNLVPSSWHDPCPWGTMDLSLNDEGKRTAHLLDADLTDLFLEYWGRGPTVTGIGIRLTGRSYYGILGFHFYGQSGWGRNTRSCRFTVDDAKPGAILGKGDQSRHCVAGIITKAPDAGLTPSHQVITSLPVWCGESTAPETRGLFTKGSLIW